MLLNKDFVFFLTYTSEGTPFILPKHIYLIWWLLTFICPLFGRVDFQLFSRICDLKWSFQFENMKTVSKAILYATYETVIMSEFLWALWS